MGKPISMNVDRHGRRPWMQLAQGVFLACLLALSACSSSGVSNIPQSSSSKARAADGGTAESGSDSSVETVSSKPKDGHLTKTLPAHEEKRTSPGRRIYFSDGDVALSDESKNLLRQHADYLKQNPKRLIVLRAYLDRLSSRAFSLAIAQERLNAVVETLREQGVAKARIRQVMLGQRGKNKVERIELLYQ